MDHPAVTVRLFGALYALQKERGGATVLEVELPPEGITGTELAAMLDLPVIAVHYRLAPEAPFPAAPDDCEAATRWIA